MPIKWLIDEENDIALSERILFAGVQFQNKLDYSGDFYNTDIKDFIDCFFSKQIIPSVSVEKTNQEKNKQKTKIKKYCN